MYDCRSLPAYAGQFVDIQKENLLLHRPVLNKASRLSSARMFVRLYSLLLIHCIYVSVTKPTCHAFSAWLNIGSIRPLKVTGKAIMLCSMALPSKLCVALHGQSNVGSIVIASHAGVWTCQFWWKFYQELRVTMVQVPEGTQCQLKVNIMSNRKKVLLTKDAPLSFHLVDYVLYIGQFLLDFASLKTLLACNILWGCER